MTGFVQEADIEGKLHDVSKGQKATCLPFQAHRDAHPLKEQ
jgi:hypothetical protein